MKLVLLSIVLLSVVHLHESSIDHCLVYGLKNAQGNETCYDCAEGWFVEKDPTRCLACSPKCAACKYQRDSCTKCRDGYMIDGSTCTACISHCNRCSDDKTCLECFDYYYRNSSGQCSPCPLDCIQCKTGSDCSKCVEGFKRIKVEGNFACFKSGISITAWVCIILSTAALIVIFYVTWWHSRQNKLMLESDQIISEVLRKELSHEDSQKTEEEKESELREQMDFSHIEHSSEPQSPEDSFENSGLDQNTQGNTLRKPQQVKDEQEDDEQPTL